MEDVYRKAESGREIWLKIKNKHQINYSDLIIFCELENSDINKFSNEIISNEIDERRLNRVFLISALKDTAIDNVCDVYISRDDYENLRLYYLITIFHSRVRFISDKEPFGNLKLYDLNERIREDYLRRAVLKI